jgi:hypothetical protein
MSDVLARQAIVLVNYPEGVKLPGDNPPTGRSKGISDLNSNERIKLLDALRDPVHPVHFVSRPDHRQGMLFLIVHHNRLTKSVDFVRNKRPSIIGIAPPHDSEHEYGRRKFADNTSDRKGLPRRERSPEGSEASLGEAPEAPEDGPTTRSRGRASKTTNVAPKAKPVRGKRVVKSASIVVSDDDSSPEKSDSEDPRVKEPAKRPRKHQEKGKMPASREPRGTSVEDGIPVDSSGDDTASGPQDHPAPNTHTAAATAHQGTQQPAPPARPQQQPVDERVTHQEARGARENASEARLDIPRASNEARRLPLAKPMDKAATQQEARVALDDSSEAQSDTTWASNDARPDARQTSKEAPRNIPESTDAHSDTRRASNEDPGAVEVSIATASKTAPSNASGEVQSADPGRTRAKGKERAVKIAVIDANDVHARVAPGKTQSKTRLPTNRD